MIATKKLFTKTKGNEKKEKETLVTKYECYVYKSLCGDESIDFFLYYEILRGKR